MKHKTALISILVLLFLSAFSQNPRPLLALPLPEGRTLDEGHDSGFIDWSGSVGYVNLNHKDGICPSACWEQVTRIHNGGTVSGAFAPVDVAYFEVMVAFTHNSAAGTAVLNACGSSATWYLYVGPGSGLPGFVSMSVPVPSGCTAWSLSASGGYVDFRSVDANYVSPPPPVSTNTLTPIPTETFTPSPIATDPPSPTVTETPAATETLAPGATPSDTPMPTDTPSPILTNTPSATLPPGVTPSDTPVPSNTPLPPIWTNTPKPSSGGGQDGNPPVTPFVAFPTATHTRFVAAVVPTVSVIKTSTPAPASTSTPRLIVTLPASELACTPSTDSDFPWWLLPAGLTLASAFSLLGTLVKNLNLDTAAWQVGDFSISPFGVTLRVPHLVPRVTTIGEWMTRPVRTLVHITRTIWRTITEAIPRFITVTRQVIDRIVHSEWVTTFKQVAKTFWEKVTEKVPLLGWLGKVIGFIWKTVVKPVIRWVTEAIRTLRTWVENVVRWVVEKIQDGWNYITRQIAETIHEWVEKTEWVRDWVTKEITVWETVWEKKFYPFSTPSGGGGGGGGALYAPALQTWSKVLKTFGIGTALATLATTANFCVNPFFPSSCTPTATPNVTMTYTVGTQFANFVTQTAMALTLTPTPTATVTIPLVPTQAPCTTVQAGEGWLAVAGRLGVHIWDLDVYTNTIPQLGQTVCWKNPPPPVPTGAIVFQASNTSCLEIAAMYGVSLEDLENANANRAHTDGQNNVLVIDWNNRDENGQPKCVIQPNAKIVVPRPTLLSVSEAVQKYSCAPQPSKECLKSNASVEEVLQYVLYNEGGSTEGSQFSANVMQVMINRTNQLLEKWNISRESMSKDEYARWLLHVISMPADADETAPAFEAFFRASEPVDLNNKSQADNWNAAAQIAQAALDGQSLSPAPQITSDVQFYCSVKKDSIAPPITFVLQVNGISTNTYFFTSFPPSVSEWCQINSPNP